MLFRSDPRASVTSVGPTKRRRLRLAARRRSTMPHASRTPLSTSRLSQLIRAYARSFRLRAAALDRPIRQARAPLRRRLSNTIVHCQIVVASADRAVELCSPLQTPSARTMMPRSTRSPHEHRVQHLARAVRRHRAGPRSRRRRLDGHDLPHPTRRSMSLLVTKGQRRESRRTAR